MNDEKATKYGEDSEDYNCNTSEDESVAVPHHMQDNHNSTLVVPH